MIKDLREKITALAVTNALRHEGKAQLKTVLGMFLKDNPEYKSKVKEIIDIIKEIVNEINSYNINDLKSKYPEWDSQPEQLELSEKKELPPLPNVKKFKKIIMRLAPFPSGPLHIGNARMVILNDYYVKRYKGKLILAFDDTIGSTEKFVIPEAYEMIKDDLEFLGVKWNQTVYKSDRIQFSYCLLPHFHRGYDDSIDLLFEQG